MTSLHPYYNRQTMSNKVMEEKLLQGITESIQQKLSGYS